MSMLDEEVYEGPNLNVILTCPECKRFPPELVERFSEGDIVCGLCGLVLSDRLVDTRSEWRTFSNDDQNGDDPSRVGDASNPLLDGDQLSTVIGYDSRDNKSFLSLSKTQRKNVLKKENVLESAYARISQMCDGYSLPKIVQDAAKEIYKLSYEEKTLKGKSQESIMAAAIFLGCRKANVARTFKEIWALTKVPKKEIGKVSKIIKKIIDEKALKDGTTIVPGDQLQSTQTTASDIIRRFCSNLGLSVEVTNGAEYIARKANETGVLSGRSPITIAAAVIYMAVIIFKAHVQPIQISDKTGVSDNTIKNIYRFLYIEREKLVDPAWIKKGMVDLNNLPNN
ncbi:transcription factor TFIIB [Ascoidea rubescens DSM 1968]|uniref:Transcription initiation factor IIB n=1 Tax=Ascoidea rubescens DSM 1968 TaxID=1344418 RepID=A0A1D2VBL8_9ASCO|nr:transcription factor TFIIB, a general transcription factor [Ascoidea rubescens DSM 1968]ODV58873.1 transcription factor TFIIB, a general transcription factor [Ascoidea rubescens DSM 1968]